MHAGDPFVIPNPWDAGSARALAKLGFKALASTNDANSNRLRRSVHEPAAGGACATGSPDEIQNSN